jgi:hypothetical protein
LVSSSVAHFFANYCLLKIFDLKFSCAFLFVHFIHLQCIASSSSFIHLAVHHLLPACIVRFRILTLTPVKSLRHHAEQQADKQISNRFKHNHNIIDVLDDSQMNNCME